MRTTWLQRFFLVIIFCTTCTFYVTRAASKPKDPPLFPRKEDVISTVCNSSSFGGNNHGERKVDDDDNTVPVIYFVTPTFRRREQVAELIRLGQTLLHVSNLVWIVAEDSSECSPALSSLLHRKFAAIPSVHIASPMPRIYQKAFYKPRGVSSRNSALDWITAHAPGDREGVVYFADDDNTYDLRLFDEIRSTRRLSMFPVGLIGDQGISSPIVRDGKVIGFTDPWFEKRRFPVDMAGFAFNVRLLREEEAARMPYKAGHEEDLFLRSLNLEMEDIEPKAKDCTEVLVWHTQAVRIKVPNLQRLVSSQAGDDDDDESSLARLMRELEFQGVITVSESGGSKVPVCMQSAC